MEECRNISCNCSATFTTIAPDMQTMSFYLRYKQRQSLMSHVIKLDLKVTFGNVGINEFYELWNMIWSPVVLLIQPQSSFFFYRINNIPEVSLFFINVEHRQLSRCLRNTCRAFIGFIIFVCHPYSELFGFTLVSNNTAFPIWLQTGFPVTLAETEQFGSKTQQIAAIQNKCLGF